MTRKIITEHIFPPIPIRQFDWQAGWDLGSSIEYGATEQEATFASSTTTDLL